MRQLTLPSLTPRKGPAGKRRRSAVRGAAKPRKAPFMRWAPRWLLNLSRPAASALAVAVILIGGVVFWRGGGADALGAAILDWTGSAGIAVEEVLVVGRAETSADRILAALDVRKGSPLFAFSPSAARERLLALGWVRDARVERRFPNVIYVDIEERRPAAIWQNAGTFALVDDSGAVIGREPVARFPSLRIIVGPDAPESFAALFAALATRPEMLEHVKAAVRVGGRRWNLNLDNGMTVLLPEEGIARAWRILANAAGSASLLERDVVQIDLRIPDRLVLRLAPAAAKEGDADGGA